jgi:uncharacterized RDD family membrane protein YckC
MSGSSTPPGWYPDPNAAGQQRYWDGAAWTENTAPGAAGAPAVAAYGAPTQVGYGYAQGGVELAGFGSRLGAYIIDGLIVGVPFVIVFNVAYAISEAFGWLVYILGLVGVVYYFAHFEGGPTGQTIGKKQAGIRVVDADTMQPGIGMGRGVGRYFARILSSFLCGLGYFWMLWDPQNQCWHDKIVSTKVTKG